MEILDANQISQGQEDTSIRVFRVDVAQKHRLYTEYRDIPFTFEFLPADEGDCLWNWTPVSQDYYESTNYRVELNDGILGEWQQQYNNRFYYPLP